MRARVLIAGLSLLLLSPVTGQGVVWNLYNDFSASQNPNGCWSFGWRQTVNDPLILYTDTSPFGLCVDDPNVHPWTYHWNPIALTVAQNANDYTYSCNGCDYPPHSVWFHPGPTEQCVVRWTAPGDMQVYLEAHFLALDDGSSIVHVYRNNADLFTAPLADIGATADCYLNIDCNGGDEIDIAVDAVSFYNDSVRLDLVIESSGPVPVSGTSWGKVKALYR